MVQKVLCCDWGTSSFRLRLMRVADAHCLGEVSSGEGIGPTFTSWQAAGGDRIAFYTQIIRRHIKRLSSVVETDLDTMPVLLSGMASASIGMLELPYAPLPFSLNGNGLSVREVPPTTTFPHPMYLISGVCSGEDVMRGEETQLVGIALSAALPSHTDHDTTFIFPGTHSKHMTVRAGQLVAFRTFMTGEVFNLMATQSILKASVDAASLHKPDPAQTSAFRAGVQMATQHPLLHSLFQVRTNQLFQKYPATENAYFLSGLLIGYELIALPKTAETQLVLCSGSGLQPFYELALDALGLLTHTHVLAPELVEQSASLGQLSILTNQLTTS